MARVKLSPLFSQIRGSLGRATFQRSQGGTTLRNKPLPSQKLSKSQQLVKSHVSMTIAAWQGLSDAQRALWHQFANFLPHYMHLNKNLPISGYSLFTKYNLIRLSAGLDMFLDITFLSTTFLAVNPSILFNNFYLYFGFGAQLQPNNIFALLKLSSTVRDTANFNKSSCRVILLNLNENNPFNITDAYKSIFFNLPALHATLNCEITLFSLEASIIFPTTSYRLQVSNYNRYSDNPILTRGAPGKFDDLMIYCPRLLKNIDNSFFKDASGDYFMFYACSGTPRGYNNDVTGLALSKDLLTWSRYDENNPVLDLGTSGKWDDADVVIITALFYAGSFHAWYEGNSDPSVDSVQIGYATSVDGKSWTKYIGNPVVPLGGVGAKDRYDLYTPCVILDGATWKMWYTGHDSYLGGNYGIMYATAPAPHGPWTKYSNQYIFLEGTYTSPTEVWKEGNVYYMTYFLESRLHIFLAKSYDGINWTKIGSIYTIGAPGTWDDVMVYWPSMADTFQGFLLFYCGYSGTDFAIGVAGSNL